MLLKHSSRLSAQQLEPGIQDNCGNREVDYKCHNG